jgi:hypothetical protein
MILRQTSLPMALRLVSTASTNGSTLDPARVRPGTMAFFNASRSFFLFGGAVSPQYQAHESIKFARLDCKKGNLAVNYALLFIVII